MLFFTECICIEIPLPLMVPLLNINRGSCVFSNFYFFIIMWYLFFILSIFLLFFFLSVKVIVVVICYTHITVCISLARVFHKVCASILLHFFLSRGNMCYAEGLWVRNRCIRYNCFRSCLLYILLPLWVIDWFSLILNVSIYSLRMWKFTSIFRSVIVGIVLLKNVCFTKRNPLFLGLNAWDFVFVVFFVLSIIYC